MISGVAPTLRRPRPGLRVGDAIVAVDGTTLEEAGSSEALALLVPGESGTDVQVTVLRNGQTFTATMTRAEVVFPTATGPGGGRTYRLAGGVQLRREHRRLF